MDITGKIAVQRNKKERSRQVWLTVGIIALIITIICEILLGIYATLALIIPLIYLLNLRNRMGNKTLFKDVAISFKSGIDEKQLEVSNCEYRDKILYSVRFTIKNDNDVNITYHMADERVTIYCLAKKDLFLGNTVIPSLEEQQCNIELYVKNIDAQKIANEFQTSVNYIS